MFSSFVFYIFATTLILVQCMEFNHPEPDEPHNYTEPNGCDSTLLSQISKNRRNAVLMPRERLVVLNPKPDYEFMPRAVSVKRCNGHCENLRSPMPTEAKMKEFVVQLHRKGNFMAEKCVSVQVKEHTKCRCECMKTKENCNERQYWDEGNCDCPCKNRSAQKSHCERIAGMVWHDKDCTCKCHKSAGCAH